MHPFFYNIRISLAVTLLTFMAGGSNLIADVVVPGVGADPGLTRLVFVGTINLGFVIDYRGDLGADDTLFWEKDFDPKSIIAATNRRSLYIARFDYKDSGLYQPVVVSAKGVRRGQICRIEVEAPTAVMNCSLRVTLTADGAAPTVGFVLANGPSNAGVAIRAIGPGLVPFGINSPGRVKELVVYDSLGRVAIRALPANRNSLDSANEFVSRRSGAFPAVIGDVLGSTALAPGAYTMVIIPESPGEVLLEVYRLVEQ